MTRQLFFDVNGEPIDAITWETLEEQREPIMVTVVGDARVVSAWLGIDYDYGYSAGTDGPKIYETRVFGGKLNGRSCHFAMLDETTAGHDAAVAKLKETAEDRAVAEELRWRSEPGRYTGD